MTGPTLTEQHYRIIEHMLIGSGRSEIPYRNHYCAGQGHDDQPLLEDLERLGLVVGRPYPLDEMGDSRIYHATQAGKRRWIEWRNAAGKGPRLYRPANHEDGEDFEHMFCGRCERSAAHRRDPEVADACPILARAMLFPIDHSDFPAEWLTSKGSNTCTAFQQESETV